MDYQESSFPPGQRPPSLPRRDESSSSWLWMLLILLIIILVTPYLAERIQYSLTRGELRARGEQMRAQAEAAEAKLQDLAANAQLVKLSDTSRAFRLVAQRVGPSVVHIDVESVVRGGIPDELSSLFFPPETRQGQGSGVIVDPEGYIITNYHVVQNADRIAVGLADGQRVRDVEIVGFDVLTDLAVLKIDVPNLVAAKWGDSDELQVGDWVLAVGNPFGLDRTVTAGIVSAKNRRGFTESAYHDFLQTDAAVNPGNSGGPLVNVMGEIVGINTAIVGRAYQGISFAIPSEIAIDIFNRLREEGKVVRGWLGVELTALTPELARQLDVEMRAAPVVKMVLDGSPAAKAGMQPGDIIISWDGEEVHDPVELTLLVGRAAIGSKIKVGIVRDGKEMTLTVTIAERPSQIRVRR